MISDMDSLCKKNTPISMSRLRAKNLNWDLCGRILTLRLFIVVKNSAICTIVVAKNFGKFWFGFGSCFILGLLLERCAWLLCEWHNFPTVSKFYYLHFLCTYCSFEKAVRFPRVTHLFVNILLELVPWLLSYSFSLASVLKFRKSPIH